MLVDTKLLKQIVKFAGAKDKLRPYLQAVKFNYEHGTIEATNAHIAIRVGGFKPDSNDQTLSCYDSALFDVSVLNNALKTKAPTLEFTYDKINGVEAETIEGYNYPDFTKAIPPVNNDEGCYGFYDHKYLKLIADIQKIAYMGHLSLPPKHTGALRFDTLYGSADRVLDITIILMPMSVPMTNSKIKD